MGDRHGDVCSHFTAIKDGFFNIFRIYQVGRQYRIFVCANTFRPYEAASFIMWDDAKKQEFERLDQAKDFITQQGYETQ